MSNAWEKETDRRISELEASLEPKLKLDYMLKMNQLVENDKAHQALYNKLFKEIAELREANIVRHNECSGVYDDLLSLKGVLRELNDRLIETLSGEIEGQSLEWFIKESDKVLEKLDSGGVKVRSAAHTECKWETSECCMKPETVKEEELIDEKPPEPKEDDIPPPYEYITITEMKEYLRRHEPNNILVKREDLDFLIYHFDGEYYSEKIPELKRIREEYNL